MERNSLGRRLPSITAPAVAVLLRHLALGARGDEVRQSLEEGFFQIPQRHPILRPARACEGGLHRPQVEFQNGRVLGIGRALRMEQLLLLAVALHALHQLLRSAGALEIHQGLLVHREEPDRRAVLG